MSYEDQMSAAKFKADRDALAQAVQGVCEDMEAHALGVEGMEDAPVTRWDRDLRAALGGMQDRMQEAIEHAMNMDPNAQRLLQEDDDAAKWVREHGGLELLITHEETFKQLMRERDRYRDLYRRSCAASGDLAEWKREVYELCEYIGVNHEDCDGEKEMLEKAYKLLDKRLMPEGYEWPRYEDSEPVRIGDEVNVPAGNITVEAIEFSRGKVCVKDAEDGDWNTSYYAMHPLKRPQVLAADGDPLEVGQTVWGVETGSEEVIDRIECVDGGAHRVYYESGGWDYPSHITHQRPVLDADGVPIHEGDTVYFKETGEPITVVNPFTTRLDQCHTVECDDGFYSPEKLTHTKPETPDSWERIENDATVPPSFYCYCKRIGGDDSMSASERMAVDLVRRCKKLAGVSE